MRRWSRRWLVVFCGLFLAGCLELELRLALVNTEEAVFEASAALNLNEVPPELRGMLPPPEQLAAELEGQLSEQVFVDHPELVRGPMEATTDVTADRIAHRRRVALHLAGFIELLARTFEDVGGTDEVVVRDGVAGTITRGGPVTLSAADRQLLEMLPGALPRISFVLDLPDDWPIQAPVIRINGVPLPVEPTTQAGRRWTLPIEELLDPAIDWVEIEVTHPLLRDDAPSLQQLLAAFQAGQLPAAVPQEATPAPADPTPAAPQLAEREVVADAAPEAPARLPDPAPATAPDSTDQPILLLHDIAADATAWDAVVRHLEAAHDRVLGGRLVIMDDPVQCPPEAPCAGFWGRPARGDVYVADFADPRANHANGLGIVQQGREVGAMLARLRELHGPDSRFVVVGHGMGGLAARSYLAGLATTYQGAIAELVTIATPHGGTPLAELLAEPELRRLLVRQGLQLRADDQGVRDLAPAGSAFLAELQSRPLDPAVRYTTIIAADPACGATAPLFERLGPSDCLVPLASQDLRNDPAAHDLHHAITVFRTSGASAAAPGARRTPGDPAAIACALGFDCSTVCSLGPVEAEPGAAVCGIALAGAGETLALGDAPIAIPDPWGAYDRHVHLSTAPSGDLHVLLLCTSGFCADVRMVNTAARQISPAGQAGRYGPHADWTSWAPDEGHVALYSTGEGFAQLHLVRAADGKSFPHPDYRATDPPRGGAALVDRESLRWLGPHTLDIRVVPCPSASGTPVCPAERLDHPGEWRRLTLGADGLTVAVRH